MNKFWRNHGLTVTMFALFALFLVGQALTGWQVFNQDQTDHGLADVGLGQYLQRGHFIEAVFENWESEFLQMGSYVFLTVYLFQKGSAESRDPRGRKPKYSRHPRLWLYENSLGLAFLGLFVASFLLHAAGGSHEACREAAWHGQECPGMFAYLTTSQFWFESFQNWQSEFLAVGAIVVLSIFLRQKGSPESRPVR